MLTHDNVRIYVAGLMYLHLKSDTREAYINQLANAAWATLRGQEHTLMLDGPGRWLHDQTVAAFQDSLRPFTMTAYCGHGVEPITETVAARSLEEAHELFRSSYEGIMDALSDIPK